MVANPMQKMKRNATLLGVIIGLIIGLLICAIIYVVVLQPVMETGVSNKDTVKEVAVLNKTVKSGDVITAADYFIKKVNSQNAPIDSVIRVEENSVAKIDLTAGTVLSNSMVTTADSKLTNDLREQ